MASWDHEGIDELFRQAPDLRKDTEKLFVWPAYLALLRRRLRCDVCLVVLTQSHRVARWASQAIALGPGCSLTPLVLSPGNVSETQRERILATSDLELLGRSVRRAATVGAAQDLFD